MDKIKTFHTSSKSFSKWIGRNEPKIDWIIKTAFFSIFAIDCLLSS